MAKRNPAGSGPGRGTPRSRTTSRPGERASRRSNTQPLPKEEAEDLDPQAVAARPLRPRAGAITWRLLVLVVVLLGLAIVLGQSLRIYFIQAGQLADVREQIAVTQEEIAEQKDQLERWKDPEYVKSQARVRLGWVMPGEVGYRVIGADGQPIDGSETVGSTKPGELSGPWFERMWKSVEIADEPLPAENATDPADDRVIGIESPSPSPAPPSPSPSPTNE